MAISQLVGARVRRREDPRLITGSATYLDDLRPPDLVHLVFARSYVPHADLTAVDVSEARAAPGVLAIYTAEELDGLPAFPVSGPKGTRLPARPLLCRDRIRYQGEPYAIVVARSREEAVDAADLITSELTQRPAVTNVDDAQHDTAIVHEALKTNVAYESRRLHGDIEAAFTRAVHVVKARIRNQRVAGIPIEPRGVLAIGNRWEPSLTVWTSTQIPHEVRGRLASFLGVPEAAVRVIAPEVGGGFGSKLSVYPEDLLIPWVAMQLGRPVKWVETRSEHFQATTHGRDQVHDLELALDGDGRILGLRGRILADLGAYPMGAGLARLTRRIITGWYQVPAAQVDCVAVYTNKTPVAAYRGAGRPEAIFSIERLMDLAARRLDLDPVEIRRRNLLPPFSEPVVNVMEEEYDSGNYAAALDRAMALVDYVRTRQEQAAARASGKLIGVGVACYLELAGFGPDSDLFESASVRVQPDGTVTVITGTSPHGQGHETAWSQLVATELGIPAERVTVLHGDTAAVPVGVGTFGSRSAAVGGVAVHAAARAVEAKARVLAAHLLEAAPVDIVFDRGAWHVRGVPTRTVRLTDVAGLAYGAGRPPDVEAGLEATQYYQPTGMVVPFGAHVAVVELDPETGAVTLQRYVSVDDCGVVLNLLLVEGQVHGGLAQGLAQGLFEEVVYGSDGELSTGNLLTYMVPTAPDLPSFTLDRTVTPSPRNPLGVKGVGEAATIGSTPAIVNAVLDALTPYGIDEMDPPCTPLKVWAALQAAGLRAQAGG
jgi:aerobic carbon-monoxide dehydrogenase large subunit